MKNSNIDIKSNIYPIDEMIEKDKKFKNGLLKASNLL